MLHTAADGLARKFMFQSIGKGVGRDEMKLVSTTDMPIAVVGGKNDPAVNYGYIQDLNFANPSRS